jgi:hypothetical protein
MPRSRRPREREAQDDDGERTPDSDRTISAQVIVRSRSGKRVGPEVPITSANIAEYAPAPEVFAAAADAFRAAGFEVGPAVGISFSVTGPLSRFERYFDTRLHVDERGAVARLGARPPPGGLELPLNALAPALARNIDAVVFTPPADLHGMEASLMV